MCCSPTSTLRASCWQKPRNSIRRKPLGLLPAPFLHTHAVQKCRPLRFWFIWFIWSVLFIELVFFNQTNETNQINQITVFLRWQTFSAACYSTRLNMPIFKL
jgi:hypothetical protein